MLTGTSRWWAATGAPMHFLHLSTAGSVELVRGAKAAGPAGDGGGDARTALVLADASRPHSQIRFSRSPPPFTGAATGRRCGRLAARG